GHRYRIRDRAAQVSRCGVGCSDRLVAWRNSDREFFPRAGLRPSQGSALLTVPFWNRLFGWAELLQESQRRGLAMGCPGRLCTSPWPPNSVSGGAFLEARPWILRRVAVRRIDGVSGNWHRKRSYSGLVGF